MTITDSTYLNIAFIVMAVCTLIVFTSCATILNRGGQYVWVKSEPEGAIVSTDTGLMGVTPVRFRMDRGKDHTITIEKKGYES